MQPLDIHTITYAFRQKLRISEFKALYGRIKSQKYYELPGCRIAQIIHQGSYEDARAAYYNT